MTSSPTSLPDLAPARLLLVEDDEADAFLVRELLAESDVPVEITWVRSLAEARSLTGDQFECVLLDLGLPDIDGLDVCRRLRAATPDLAIVILTARDQELDLVAGL
ncbi:MAG: hypothetical protein QOG60_2806, partial [Frankiaceae bacterium]|nr:hypothetical protein [Frankiaceae bacterium]